MNMDPELEMKFLDKLGCVPSEQEIQEAVDKFKSYDRDQLCLIALRETSIWWVGEDNKKEVHEIITAIIMRDHT